MAAHEALPTQCECMTLLSRLEGAPTCQLHPRQELGTARTCSPLQLASHLRGRGGKSDIFKQGSHHFERVREEYTALGK